jgi:hypothetical protein
LQHFFKYRPQALLRTKPLSHLAQPGTKKKSIIAPNPEKLHPSAAVNSFRHSFKYKSNDSSENRTTSFFCKLKPPVSAAATARRHRAAAFPGGLVVEVVVFAAVAETLSPVENRQ